MSDKISHWAGSWGFALAGLTPGFWSLLCSPGLLARVTILSSLKTGHRCCIGSWAYCGHHALRERAYSMNWGIPWWRCDIKCRCAASRFFIFGGVAQIGAEPPEPFAEFLIAIAGPVVSLTLASLFLRVQPLVSGVQPLLGLAKYLA